MGKCIVCGGPKDGYYGEVCSPECSTLYALWEQRGPGLLETRALLIEMRRYIVKKGFLIGECVAWTKLKKLYGVGIDQSKEDAWAAEYRTAQRAAPKES